MTDDLSPDDVMAAEYALGLLEGEELLAARAREASDAAFAEDVALWNRRLAPLLDDIPPQTPREDVWQHIVRELDSAPSSAEVISLNASVRRWKVATGFAAAAAIAAISLFVLTPAQTPGPAPAVPGAIEAPLAASIPIGDTALRLAVTYLPEREELFVSASGLTADGVHDHELWLVPRDEGPLMSLGVVAPGEERRVALSPEIAAQMADGSDLLLTREPLGGKPSDAEAGPVVAEGRLKKI